MSAFRALVWKEWRDSRATMLVALAVSVVLSIAFHALLPRGLHGEWTAVFAVCAMPTLFALVLASDLIAGDARDGRIATLRALPVSPIAAFGAKLSWLVLASGAFLAWCFALQFPVLLWFEVDGAMLDYLNTLERTTPLLLLGVALGAGALFASSFAVGGLKAMFVSVLLVGLPLAAGLSFARGAMLPLTPAHVSLYALVLSAAALIASAIAWCRGRLHAGARWRPALVAWSALVICALPPTGFAAWRSARGLSLGPESPRMCAQSLTTSPNGRYVAVQAADTTRRNPRRLFDVGSDRVTTVWMIEVENGTLEVLDGGNWQARRWSDEGALYLERERERARALDPATMSLDDARIDSHDLYAPWEVAYTWARLLRPQRSGDPVRVRWEERGLTESFDAKPQDVVPQHVPGVVLHQTKDGWLVRRELGGDSTTLVEGGLEPQWDPTRLSMDDRFILASRDDAGLVLDAHSGERVAGPWPFSHVSWLCEAPPGRFVLVSHRQHTYHVADGLRCTLVDLDAGEEVELGRLKHVSGSSNATVRRLPDGRLVVLRPNGAVELLAADGTSLRVLLEGSSKTGGAW